VEQETKTDDLQVAWDADRVADAVARLGYPQFLPLSGGPKEDPATVLLCALSADHLDARVVETLPWLAITFHDSLDWEWLADQARQRRTQNRLGFIASLGWRFAEKHGNQSAARTLRNVEELIAPFRLADEGTLCHDLMSNAERRWLRNSRPDYARYWNLLTDLVPEHLYYGE
jgi:hypothetical protein